MIGKILGFFGLLVKRKGIISSPPFSLDFLSSSNDICKSLFMLFSIKALGYFYAVFY